MVRSKVEGRIAELKISDFPVSGFVKLREKTRFAPPCRDLTTPQSAIRNPQSAIDRAFRPGYTLIELVMAMAIAGILLMGMSASIVIASRCVSEGYDVVGLALRTSDALGEVNSDLSTAEDFLDRTSSSVTFTVPDRDGDGVSETVKYWWTGSSDGRLMRQVNGGPEVVLAENVRQFALTYGLTTMAAEEQSDSDDGGKIWHGRQRRPRWGWYWDHRGNAWGHYDYKPGKGNGNNNGNGNGKN
jgi:prepilin-type N-terminal cleavage/methylation domain-containing protein